MKFYDAIKYLLSNSLISYQFNETIPECLVDTAIELTEKAGNFKSSFILYTRILHGEDLFNSIETVIITAEEGQLIFYQIEGYLEDTEIVNIELAKYPAEEISFLEDSEKTILLNKLNQWALSEAINNF